MSFSCCLFALGILFWCRFSLWFYFGIRRLEMRFFFFFLGDRNTQNILLRVYLFESKPFEIRNSFKSTHSLFFFFSQNHSFSLLHSPPSSTKRHPSSSPTGPSPLPCPLYSLRDENGRIQRPIFGLVNLKFKIRK